MEQVGKIIGSRTVSTGMGDIKFGGYVVSGLWAKREQGVIIPSALIPNFLKVLRYLNRGKREPKVRRTFGSRVLNQTSE
ncbi:MAG: hypothetical protein LBP80_11405 [Treponema sp.]|jgi:hypothetical protein|nr:hypothetical protein [Treponema sp.]